MVVCTKLIKIKINCATICAEALELYRGIIKQKLSALNTVTTSFPPSLASRLLGVGVATADNTVMTERRTERARIIMICGQGVKVDADAGGGARIT